MSNSATIEDILSPHGYRVHYVTREKYRGSERTTLCIAEKGGARHYAFKICAPDDPDHHRRIQSIEDLSPRVARFYVTVEGIVLSVEAPGHNLWEIEPAPDPHTVEAQLIEFALWTQRHQLIHGDLRPWNVFFDNDHGVQVIDWLNLSAFVDDLLPRGELPPRRNDLLGHGHYANVYPDLVAERNFTEIDLRDARLIGKLLKGEIGLAGAWPRGSHPSWRPSWCKP
jgi:Phosphotransferase enzyme family